MAKVQVNVLVADDHRDRFDEVARDAEAAGLVIEQRLEGVGVMVGTASTARVGALRRVQGVAAVEQSRTIRLPPPDAPIQ